MNQRTKSLWLPAMATLLGASLLLAAVEFSGFRPRLLWLGQTGVQFYWPWLVGLPAFGAMGAGWSRRAHGRVSARLAAGLSPALVMLITMCAILPWGLAADGFHSSGWCRSESA